MKFIIGVDCEGVACVVGSPGGSLNVSRDLEFAKLQATREANAAAQGLFAAGATRVIVWDNHNGSLNLHYDELDERCEVALGVGFPHRWPGLDGSFAGVLFIGYHPRDNTVDGVIAHTFSSRDHQWVKVNGQEVGEMAIDAAMAGEAGVPVLFAASDDKGVAEAQALLPWIGTVTTKQAMGWNAAISKHPSRVVREIREEVQKAVPNLKACKPYTFKAPLTYEVRYKRLEAAEAAARGRFRGQRLDAYTVSWTVDTLSQLY